MFYSLKSTPAYYSLLQHTHLNVDVCSRLNAPLPLFYIHL